ncbi:DUF1642 domain-containing protein [Streptococcus macedonicus]|uniref:DUF1642 domain-containing protein n=1 Tax=Streptococcus macedonicus TaxID=59310 RepID=UPI001BDCFB10|nr:DUF1642 domain-containing protein [Streptococcus macedonicus]MBT1048567.1 DUF1642 domain-containing protein [Streptococcus macedonicus]
MNKQEVIEKIKKEKSPFNSWEGLNRNNALDDALDIVEKLDEPEKPVVPQFVADWYEENKDDFEYNLYRLCIDFRKQKLRTDLQYWFGSDVNKPIETLVKMKLYGYEVEKEKLYTVEIPNPNSKGNNKIYLCKDDTTGKVYLCKGNFNPSRNRNLRLTESEIKQDFAWAWQFAKEVEE